MKAAELRRYARENADKRYEDSVVNPMLNWLKSAAVEGKLNTVWHCDNADWPIVKKWLTDNGYVYVGEPESHGRTTIRISW